MFAILASGLDLIKATALVGVTNSSLFFHQRPSTNRGCSFKILGEIYIYNGVKLSIVSTEKLIVD